MIGRLTPLLALFTLSCVIPKQVQDDLVAADANITLARAAYANLCAPINLADAESQLAFARLELRQGYLKRAGDHASNALGYSLEAIAASNPCGTADDDNDGIPNIVDRCPNEPEDLDGVEDDDGCPELDPYGDEDGDGIINLEDGCPFVPEDFDGDADEDGCPETSEDSDGDGIIDALDECPNEPEDYDNFKDWDGCPDPDNDGDGILDIFDKCPNQAEDFDGFEDEDGCPDPDNDGDGIPDVFDKCPNQPGDRSRDGCPSNDADNDGIPDELDQCPNEPETINGYLDDDGCPDVAPTRVKVTATRVEITETIQFDTGKATIVRTSNGILDEVVKVLNDAPSMRLRVEGHTDSEGSDSVNTRLSNERALAVKTYLERAGIAASRVESIGFGSTRPIDTNRTPAGRARNRRVEFHIIQDAK